MVIAAREFILGNLTLPSKEIMFKEYEKDIEDIIKFEKTKAKYLSFGFGEHPNT